MRMFRGQRKWQDNGWIKRHSLSLVLAAMLILQTLYAVWAGHRSWMLDAADHGAKAEGWPTDFWIWWSWEYNVSLVADTFGVILIVLLSKWLYEKDSAEADDPPENQ